MCSGSARAELSPNIFIHPEDQLIKNVLTLHFFFIDLPRGRNLDEMITHPLQIDCKLCAAVRMVCEQRKDRRGVFFLSLFVLSVPG